MADALSVIPSTVLGNLCDKLYEKRKNAAREIEGIVKQLASAGDHEKISAVINLLTTVFTYSPLVKHRKGGLMGLAAATSGLTSEAVQYLPQIVPPVLNSFSDRDSRVRYYACEALYDIAKVVRGDLIIFFNHIFDALWRLSADSDLNVQNAAHLLNRLVKVIVTESDRFSIEEFIPLLKERMNALNPFIRQFLIGWITFLHSNPDIEMLDFLSDFLDGLFNMLSDSSREIRQEADSVLSEFLQEITNSPTLPLKSVDYHRMAEILVQRAASPDEFTRLTAITWINEFVKLGGDQLVPYYSDILGAILPCISDKDERIRVVAHEASEGLLAITADPAKGFDVGAILSSAGRQLSSEWEATRIEALHWLSTLLNRRRTEPIANTEQNDEMLPLVESHELVIDIESDRNVSHRTQGSRRNGWTQKVALEWFFVIINLILEIPSAVLDQLSSEHKPQYALFAMLISFAALVICIIELIYKGRKEKICWGWRSMLPWFYYPQQNHKPFGSFRDIFGSACAFCQCIVTAVNYSASDGPIKFSFWPIFFALGLLGSKMLENPERCAIS